MTNFFQATPKVFWTNWKFSIDSHANQKLVIETFQLPNLVTRKLNIPLPIFWWLHSFSITIHNGGSLDVMNFFPMLILTNAIDALGWMSMWCSTQNGHVTLILITWNLDAYWCNEINYITKMKRKKCKEKDCPTFTAWH